MHHCKAFVFNISFEIIFDRAKEMFRPGKIYRVWNGTLFKLEGDFSVREAECDFCGDVRTRIVEDAMNTDERVPNVELDLNKIADIAAFSELSATSTFSGIQGFHEVFFVLFWN